MPKFEILVPHGFCMGVKAAIETALRALAVSEAPVYCLHELVHNECVVADLQARGLRFVDRLSDIPSGGSQTGNVPTVLFSAHGVGPAVRREACQRGLRTIDATCPFVARVHRQVRAYAARGMALVVIGHEHHVEVQGVQGEAIDAGIPVAVVADEAAVEKLAFPSETPLGVVCQTTLSSDCVRRILQRLRKCYSHVETTPAAETCTATRDRQQAVRDFVARGGDGVLVLGSARSSNTQQLVECAKAAGARAWRIESEKDLAMCAWEDVSCLGITSGASTPEDFLQKIVSCVAARCEQPGPTPRGNVIY